MGHFFETVQIYLLVLRNISNAKTEFNKVNTANSVSVSILRNYSSSYLGKPCTVLILGIFSLSRKAQRYCLIIWQKQRKRLFLFFFWT